MLYFRFEYGADLQNLSQANDIYVYKNIKSKSVEASIANFVSTNQSLMHMHACAFVKF